MKKIIFIVFLTLISTFFCCFYWKSTPQYSLKKILISYEKKDYDLFAEYFDIFMVSKNMSEELLNNIDTEQYLKKIFGVEFSENVRDIFNPIISEKISNQIIATVQSSKKMEHTFLDSLFESLLLNNQKTSILNRQKIRLALSTVFDSKQISYSKTKNTATFIIRSKELIENSQIEIVLNKSKNKWKVVEIKNIVSSMLNNKEFQLY